MTRTLYISLISMIILLFVVLEMSAPKKVNWSQTYYDKDKQPFGTYILKETLGELFDEDWIYTVSTSMYEELDYHWPINTNYININQYVEFDEESATILLKWVKDGNNAFISAQEIYSGILKDTLRFNSDYDFENNLVSAIERANDETQEVNFTNPKLKFEENYKYGLKLSNWYFSDLDTANTTVLGRYDDGKANFIRIRYGRGFFYLHSFPMAFTNYGIIEKSSSDYAYKALSYLPDLMTLWDQHEQLKSRESLSPIRFLLSQESLSWAYYIMIAGVLVFMLVSLKRKQRFIRVIAPLKNSTLEFVNALSNLYIKSSNHKNIADKKILHFLEYIRSRYLIPTNKINDEFLVRVSGKSGIELDEIKELFAFIEIIRTQSSLTSDALINLNRKIENFYKKVKYG